MKITTTRRISQLFFFSLFTWFVIVATIGEKFWQIRGWPVNWFLHLDPLVAIGTILSTKTLYWPLLWALVTVVLTILLGRFFCGWVCPFGTLHHFVGWIGRRNKPVGKQVQLNQYRKGQNIKYFVLFFLLGMALFAPASAVLQTGLLDPIPLITRSFNLVLLPLADAGTNVTSTTARWYSGAWLVFAIFLTAVLLNFAIPRFYCRFVCPLGALFGILNRFAIWRVGKKSQTCSNCKLCEKSCEGACEPASNIRIAECVLCMNCLEDCKDNTLAYQIQKSGAGEVTDPDVSRRGVVLSLASGLLAAPAVRLAAKTGENYHNKTIRPPGALPEEEFLARCIKCGQCMRVCPTNVLQPAGFEGGVEGLWTPVLNNRIGSSGCQYNCVACGQVCPTSAIRPITLEEKHGTGKFADRGPIKLGTAFFDHNRCLPWAFDKPCIVCEENCPVSPKAIYTEEVFRMVRDGKYTLAANTADGLVVEKARMQPGQFATGDHYCLLPSGLRKRIFANTADEIIFSSDEKLDNPPAEGDTIEIQVRLQRPIVDPERCIGCGVCEHECPVSGKRGVRVSAEGESRSRNRKLFAGS